MHTRDGERGVAAAAGEVAAHARSIARLELKLAAVELKEKAAALGIGAAMLLGAAVFGLFTTAFVLATVAAALAIVLPTWLALLIVTVLCAGLAAGMAVVGIGALRQAAPPVPRQAIEDAKLTAQVVANGNRYGES